MAVAIEGSKARPFSEGPAQQVRRVKWVGSDYVVVYLYEHHNDEFFGGDSDLRLEYMRMEDYEFTVTGDTYFLQNRVTRPLLGGPPVTEKITAKMKAFYSFWSYVPYIYHDPTDYGSPAETVTGISLQQYRDAFIPIFTAFYEAQYSDWPPWYEDIVIEGGFQAYINALDTDGYLDPVTFEWNLPPLIKAASTGYIPPDSWLGGTGGTGGGGGRRLYNWFVGNANRTFSVTLGNPGPFVDTLVEPLYDATLALTPTTYEIPASHEYASDYGNVVIFNLSKLKAEYKKGRPGYPKPTTLELKFNKTVAGSGDDVYASGLVYTLRRNTQVKTNEYRQPIELAPSPIDSEATGMYEGDIGRITIDLKTLQITIEDDYESVSVG